MPYTLLIRVKFKLFMFLPLRLNFFDAGIYIPCIPDRGGLLIIKMVDRSKIPNFSAQVSTFISILFHKSFMNIKNINVMNHRFILSLTFKHASNTSYAE